MVDKAFIRFLVTGGLAAAVNIGSRVLLSMLMPFGAAVAVAYLIGMTTAYVLARLFVFERSGQTVHGEFLRFTLVNLVALVQVWLVSVGLADWLFPALRFTWNADLIAHTVGVLSPVVSSYYGHKLFTFRPAADQ
ncbi:MAG: GtrA family protein [Devosia sp.]|nr:GtrA family protein [Devosia sp.]